MSKVTIMTKLSLFCLLFIAATFKVNAQSKHPLVPDTYVFSSDSLSGFDETTAKQAAFAANAYGDEFKVYMYMAKREYIKAKYNLPTVIPQLPPSAYNKGAALTTANCVNEDFEQGSLTSAVPGTLTIGSTTGVAGWTVTSGSNTGSTGSCLLSGPYTGVPNACQVISTSTASAAGAVDPIIGSTYPIYSVFGNNVNGGSAVAGNPPNMMGDWFIKINNSTGGAGIHVLKKTFAVTPANALFQFAFIAVIQGAHCCCDNAGFALKVYKQTGCTGVPTLTTCPSFTASPPAGVGCSPTGTCGAGGSTTYLNAATSGWYYNKWKVSTMDLSTYIGDCITIEVYAIDCPYSGHAGYVYFDAQCNPMAIIGNGTSFPAGTPQITLPTCGTGNTATITAPPGMGPYVWSGPDPLVNGSTAQTVTTSITGNYTITMTPPGSCGPTVKQVSVVISPAPNLAVSPQQVTCTNTLNSLSLLMSSGTAGTTTPNYTVNFTPAPPSATVGVSATTATYTGFSAGNYTCTITDANGCTATQTFVMNVAPPVPSFTANAFPTIVGCAPNNTSTASATNTGTLSNMTYTWSSTSTGTFVGNPWIVGAPTGTNVITVTGSDLVAGSCPVTQTLVINGNFAVPGCTVAPISRTLTCGSPCASFTATSSGTTNIVGVWLDQSNAVISGPSGTPLVMCTSNTGTYTAVFTNSVNGCTSSQSVTVVDNTGLVPTMSVTSNQNTFTLTCLNPQIGMNINTTSTITPKTYSWTNVTTSVTTTPVTGGYTVTVPGQYIACLNANNCVVCQTITIAQDTVKPIVSSITSLPSSSYTLTCAHPVLTASAVTSPMLPLTSYSWTTPPNLTVSQPTISVSLANITSSTSPTSYTVLAMGANGCVGRQKVLISKDIFVPPYTAVFTPSAITCAVPCVALSTGASTSTVPVTFTFTSPAPTMTANTNGYLFCNPGTYTMTYQSTLNGCTATTTTLVPLNVTPPSTVALAPIQMKCGQTTATITAGTSTTSSAYSYTWDPPSATTALSCTGGSGCYSTTCNEAGVYGVFILNTINGCSATNTITVLPPSLPVSLTANPASGFAPLPVTFANTTPSTSTSGTVTTTWTYGNGTSVTTTSAASTYTGSSTPFPGGSTIYNSAGTYTVWLVMAQNSGSVSCAGTASTVINVDLASAMTVPNVFTPNQDGVNDFFALRTTNLTEIKCTIFDRWGVKMYDVTSETGNIAWDGKNLSGAEVPEGTYFYIITAKGKDGKTEFLNDKGEKIPEKGYISLYR